MLSTIDSQKSTKIKKANDLASIARASQEKTYKLQKSFDTLKTKFQERVKMRQTCNRVGKINMLLYGNLEGLYFQIKKRNFRKYSVVFFKAFYYKIKVFGGPYIFLP